jgi:nucleoside-diphosphate-sugar epimerase
MRVFVTGGTGAIGVNVIPALIAGGHSVTALARTPEKEAWIERQGASAVAGSIFDRSALAKLFADHDAVANLATAIPRQFLRRKAWGPNDRIRTEGSAAVVDAAIAAGVPRVIQESVSMLYPDRGAEWVDEDVLIDSYPMASGNIAAEASANRFSAEGGVGVVLRFGWFYGPGATHSEEIFAAARRHVVIVLGPPGNYLSSIHMQDAGAALVAALAAPAGTFNVVDDEPLTKRDYAAALASAAESTTWLRGPGRAALLLGDRLTSLTRSLRVSNRRFKAATGWAPHHSNAREGWIATARALQHGPRSA